MAKKLDPKQTVDLREVVISGIIESEATGCTHITKGDI